MKTFWLFFDILGLGGLLAATVVMLITFFQAYSSEYKMVKVFVDRYGEANYEAVLLPFCLLWGLLAFIRFFYKKFKEY